VRRLRAEEWPRWRDLRLAALAESPDAFGGTYQTEAAFEDAVWMARALRGATAENCATFIAEAGADWLGLAGVYTDADGVPEVVSMWVRPEARGSGLGKALLVAAVDFARPVAAGRVRICHVAANDAVHGMYSRFGFQPTGRTLSLERDSSIRMVEMELG
jgi:GNAT superfamily N-acetyltransferase